MNRFSNHDDDRGTIVRPVLGRTSNDKRWVWKLKAEESGFFTSYSPKFWGIALHWCQASRRTEGHYEPVEECPGCARELARKELYYLFGLNENKGQHCFLELPDGAAKVAMRYIPPGETLRGRRLTLKRGKGLTSKIIVTAREVIEAEAACPRDEDPLPTLKELWAEKRPQAWPWAHVTQPKVEPLTNGHAV